VFTENTRTGGCGAALIAISAFRQAVHAARPGRGGAVEAAGPPVARPGQHVRPRRRREPPLRQSLWASSCETPSFRTLAAGGHVLPTVPVPSSIAPWRIPRSDWPGQRPADAHSFSRYAVSSEKAGRADGDVVGSAVARLVPAPPVSRPEDSPPLSARTGRAAARGAAPGPARGDAGARAVASRGPGRSPSPAKSHGFWRFMTMSRLPEPALLANSVGRSWPGGAKQTL
jgi:hypothetical protein